MPPRSIPEQLEALRRELARQDAEWERARSALESFGETRLPVAPEALEELEGACTVRAPAIDLHALRA